MRFAIRIIAASLALSGCSQTPAWWGQPISTQEQATASSPSVHATQALGAKVRNEIAKASQQGTDTKLALSYQTRGDEALREGELTYAAEQYGRAEEALGARGRAGIGSREGEEKAEAAPGAKHHGAELSRHRVERMQHKAKSDVTRARKKGADVSAAEKDLSEGDAALAKGKLRTAMEHYSAADRSVRGAKHASKSASAAKSGAKEETSVKEGASAKEGASGSASSKPSSGGESSGAKNE